MKLYIPVEGSPDINCIKVETFCDLGGASLWDSTKMKKRGYYVSCTPILREDKHGVWMETYVAGSGDYLGEYAHEQIARGGKLEIHDNEENEWHEMDRDALLKGIQKAYQDGWYPKYGWCDGKTLDCCNVDGDVADAIVQYAIFDNVIYG